MITHNTEAIVLVNGTMYRAPFTPSNLSGRTGRGDTTFAAYLAWRLMHNPQESLRFAAALCSIKMKDPDHFRDARGSVRAHEARCIALRPPSHRAAGGQVSVCQSREKFDLRPTFKKQYALYGMREDDIIDGPSISPHIQCSVGIAVLPEE